MLSAKAGRDAAIFISNIRREICCQDGSCSSADARSVVVARP
jgi:hypothetical protein